VERANFKSIFLMLPTSSLRALQVGVPRRITGRRFASHGPPQFNEPSGWLFGEKVMSLTFIQDLREADGMSALAPCTRTKARERGMGEHLVCRDVRVDGNGCSIIVLQA
jgi:hypothetical protein